MTSLYDFTASRLQPLDVMIVLLLGSAALPLLLGARSQLGARRPTTAVLAVVLRLSPSAATATAVADLTSALARDGWRAAETDRKTLTPEREDAVLTLAVADDEPSELLLTLL